MKNEVDILKEENEILKIKLRHVQNLASVVELEHKKDLENHLSVLLELEDANSELEKIKKNLEYTVQEKVEEVSEMAQILIKTNLELEGLLKDAKQASVAKSEFLANMSHEIRTPLNGLLGMADLLAETNLDIEQKDFVETMILSGKSLLEIINDILDFSKIEAGQLKIEKVEIDIKVIANGVLRLMQSKADERQNTLKLEFDDNIDNLLIGDPVRIQQILINLIGNAIKFTENGYINLSIERLETNNDTNSLLFKVSDTGIGIAAENVKKIFEQFSQEEGSTTRKFGGTGLGLSITKQLIELMDGKINVVSEKGHGAEFFFVLNFEKSTMIKEVAQVAKEVAQVAKEVAQVAESITVLLVEDNKINQKLAKKILEKQNCIVEIANNGREAVEAFQKNKYNIIFMDCQMPVMDGFEATATIRKLDGGNEQLIVALTANAMDGDKEICLAAGMDKFLAKPIKKQAIIDILTSINK